MQRGWVVVCVACLAGLRLAGAEPEFVSEQPELIALVEQGWGVLGLDTAAHQSSVPGQRLQIGGRSFSHGLGHHANGRIELLLEGRYQRFEAQLGLQPCPGGSVVFRVLADGELKFESEVIRSGDEARPIDLNVTGVQQLTLEAKDAGDGITCDMANWAEARLTRDAGAVVGRAEPPRVDIAPFARVVTWDPERKSGARASRVEEFRAEDLFTEDDLRPHRNGWYSIPPARQAGGHTCIGLQWLEGRHIRALGLEFAQPATAPKPAEIRVEGWTGESAWQGEWKTLEGELRVDEAGRVQFRPGTRSPVHTRKVRWVLPGAAEGEVRLSCFSRSRWETTNVVVHYDGPQRGRATIGIYNGELVAGKQTAKDGRIPWDTSEPLEVALRYSRPGLLSETTALQFGLASGQVTVALADLLRTGCIYIPDHGLFVTRNPAPMTLAEYQRQVSGRRTILEQVRGMAEQTRAQAMARTHRDYQALGPVMLSLACDNTKFIVERDGAVRFRAEPYDWSKPYEQWIQNAYELRPRFGAADKPTLTRSLEGAWLPIPVTSIQSGDVRYTQRAFAAPVGGETGARAGSLCVVEITAENTGAASAKGQVRWKLTGPAGAAAPRIVVNGDNAELWAGDRLVGCIDRVSGLRVEGSEVLLEKPLSAGESAKFVARIAGDGVTLAPAPLPTALSVAELRRATEAHWKAQLAQATQVETPDKWLNDVIRSSQVRCLIAARQEAEGRRIGASIAAMSYGPLESEAHSVIRGMDFLGHDGFARKALDYFITRYNTNGFLTTGYTTFGTAWHLWTLGEHYRLTHDDAWLRNVAPELARVSHWVIDQMEKTKRLDAQGHPVPEYGLMPPGVLADWNAFAYHFAMNAYYSAGLREVGEALAQIDYPEAKLFLKKAGELRRNTLRAYAWTQARAPVVPLRDGTWVAYYPSQVHSPGRLAEFFPGQDGGRSWCYDVELGAHQLVPTRVLPADSAEVGRMLDHMEDAQFLADGWFDYPAAGNHADWFNLGGFSKVQPYYTRNAEIYALRDDIKPFIRSYFNTLAAMISPEVLTFWEHFHNAGAYDKTHETGYFLHQTRTMLVQERGDALWLAPFVPSEWLQDGKRLVVRNAPTHFGKVGYEMASRLEEGVVEVQIVGNEALARGPREIVLRLRHPAGAALNSVAVNGKPSRRFDPAGVIRLKPAARIQVTARFDNTSRGAGGR